MGRDRWEALVQDGTGTWWRRSYTQNHHWTNHSGLGLAALVLEGEDSRTQVWLGYVADMFKRVASLLKLIKKGAASRVIAEATGAEAGTWLWVASASRRW